MQAVSVGGLEDCRVRAEFRDPDPLDRLLCEPGHIPGIKDAPLFRLQIQAGRPRDMPRRIGRHLHVQLRNRHFLLVGDRRDPFQHGEHIFPGILRDLLLATVHQLQAVKQKHPRLFHRHFRHIDPRRRISLADDRQRSCVIHMRMTDQNSVNTASLLNTAKIRKRLPVPTLPDPAVHQYPFSGNLQMYTTPAYFHGTAGEIKLHILNTPFFRLS